MTDRESAVPLDLQDAIADAETDSRRAVDLYPPAEWYDGPDCDTRLSGQSVIHEGDAILAVQYTCDCLTRWTWEQATDNLYYRGESTLVDDF